jgi:hypothetical protein
MVSRPPQNRTENIFRPGGDWKRRSTVCKKIPRIELNPTERLPMPDGLMMLLSADHKRPQKGILQGTIL